MKPRRKWCRRRRKCLGEALKEHGRSRRCGDCNRMLKTYTEESGYTLYEFLPPHKGKYKSPKNVARYKKKAPDKR